MPAIEISGLCGQFNKSLMKKIQPEGKEKTKTKSRRGQEGSQEEKQEGEQEDSRRKKKSRVWTAEGSQDGGCLKAKNHKRLKTIVVTGYGVFKDGRLIGFGCQNGKGAKLG